jgi:large subunit ribosomal protein L6
MSRVGKIPIKVPSGVKVAFQNDQIIVEGPKGKLTQKYHPVIAFEDKDGEITVTRTSDEKQVKSFHGLYRCLLNNMITGVSTGFNKSLIVTGVGYRVEVQGKLLSMSLGYSNDIYVAIPDDLSVQLIKAEK